MCRPDVAAGLAVALIADAAASRRGKIGTVGIEVRIVGKAVGEARGIRWGANRDAATDIVAPSAALKLAARHDSVEIGSEGDLARIAQDHLFHKPARPLEAELCRNLGDVVIRRRCVLAYW